MDFRDSVMAFQIVMKKINQFLESIGPAFAIIGLVSLVLHYNYGPIMDTTGVLLVTMFGMTTAYGYLIRAVFRIDDEPRRRIINASCCIVWVLISVITVVGPRVN